MTPRIFVDDVAGVVEFLREVFDACGKCDPRGPAEIQIGDSIVMASSASEREPFPAFLYVYVDDTDRAFRRAVEAGATVLEEPLGTPYGDPLAGLRKQSVSIGC